MPAPLTVATPSELEIAVTRSFDAPRDLVFMCFTKPEFVRRWLGPPGWTMPICEIDFRVGGRWRYVMRSPDGTMDMGFGGSYREIVVPYRIVHTELFDDDWTGGETLVTTTFSDDGTTTTVETLVRYSSTQARDNALASPMAEGMELGFSRLDSLLSEQPV